MLQSTITSPLGTILITANDEAITSIWFEESEVISTSSSKLIDEAVKQLMEYFSGIRKTFDLPLAPDGTEFQKKVWNSLLDIPYGKTVSYLDVSRKIGDEKAIRAVGMANGKNPISIVIPCHRVIGSDGKLTGYGGGLWRKEWLLRHERKDEDLMLL
ncbi:MAG TPA: methylated-DNA--[protein]-cysteine S-methyltransferase [Candidatus Kapabacteria bacterium]|nr:methylated-DNA--[protein]-cysteine S-methyltransferase [Candidatus Kapabacteria bacterium]